MPMTEWWERMLRDLDVTDMKVLNDPNVQDHIAKALCDPEHRTQALHSNREYPPDLLWLMRIVGAMALVRRNEPLPAIFGEKDGVARATKDDWDPIVAAVAELIADLPLDPVTGDQPDRIKKLLADPKVADQVRTALDELNKGLSRGRTIDWKLVAPFLRIPHDDTYVAPANDHGTHVAGIVAGDWRA